MSNNILLKPLRNFYSHRYNLETLLIILNSKNLVKEKQYNEKKKELNKSKKKKKSINLKYDNYISDLTPISSSLKLELDLEKKISLRLIDWFVTNYCKKYKIQIQNKNSDTNKIEYVNIYESYKSNLKAFSKQIFDPFRRKNRVFVYYNINSCSTGINNYYKIHIVDYNNLDNNKNNYKYIDTTIGQLNFFKWIIENNIYQYISNKRNDIENDMIKSQKNNNDLKLDPNNIVSSPIKTNDGKIIKWVSRKKRNELSKSKGKTLHLNKEAREIYFD